MISVFARDLIYCMCIFVHINIIQWKETNEINLWNTVKVFNLLLYSNLSVESKIVLSDKSIRLRKKIPIANHTN